VIGLFGGTFDPPHNGHVELARRAKHELGLERLHVLVAAAPGHKPVVAPAAARLELARAAFPHEEVSLDEHARTVDTLRAHPEWRDPVFLIGADQFADFLAWKEPHEVLRRARLGVATRPGYPRAGLDAVLARLDDPERVRFFEIDPLPFASRELRALAASGRSIRDSVPQAVCALIARDGLYRGGRPLH